MGIENDPYKKIKTDFDSKEEEQETVKQFTKKHEEVINDAAEHALNTNDDKLFDNAHKAGANLDAVGDKIDGKDISDDIMEQIEAMVEKLSKGKEADVEYFVNQATLLYKRQDKSLNESDKLKAVEVQIENIINSPTESKKEAVNYKGSAPVKPERNIN